MSFASTRTQLLSLESQAVSQLGIYSSFIKSSSSIDTGSNSSLMEQQTLNQISTNLKQRRELVMKLGQIVNSMATNNPIKTQQLQRHKEILEEHQRDYQRIQTQLSAARDRSNLLDSVRDDIERHRTNNLNDIDEMDYLNDERRRVNNSHGFVDMLINQAYRTREEITNQNSTLNGLNKKLMGTLSKIPGINEVIKKIGTRRRRDSIIMAAVITVCILIFFYLL